MIKLALALSALALASSPARPQPRAIAQDPSIDRTHPASGRGLQFMSRGVVVNAQLYLPAGAGAHPAIILLHGLPGNEQNLDLARAMQRAGWAVVTFHYRGSWGSGGDFTLAGGCDDTDALLREIKAPSGVAKWHIDPKRIAIMGHSFGGYVAACTAERHPELIATALIAPWDISYDARAFANLTPDAAREKASTIFDDVDGRLTGADARTLMESIRSHGAALDLTALAPALAGRPLLVATATRDDPDDQAEDLLAAVHHSPHAALLERRFETDHGFNDQRIALETFVLDWLAGLPGAPGRVKDAR